MERCKNLFYKRLMSTDRIVLIVLLAFCIPMAYLIYVGFQASQGMSGRLIAVTDDAFGGPFTLTDQNGKTVTEKDLSGKYRLIFFGFTYCPAICPTELAKITNAMKGLGDQAANIQPVFISVDPERDTPEKMKSYVSLFHPSLIGLTGTSDQVKQTLKAYKVYAAKVQDDGMSDYTMDHSSFIYFIGPDDRLLHIFKTQDTALQMTEIIGQWLSQENPR